MTTADAIIIGTGVIGSAIAFELAKTGRKVLQLDRNTAVGHGSTAGSCAIIRMHYSTRDGTAFAWEGYHDWRDWQDYLGLPSGTELARFVETGCLVMKTEANGHLKKHMAYSAELDCPFEDWTPEHIRARLPIYQLDRYAPAKRPEDTGFAEPTGGALEGGVFWPKAGYVTDPALSAQNLAAAAALHGAQVKLGADVTEILQENGVTKGVRLATGEALHAPIVVNVAGPGSAAINAMAGVLEEMTIETRPLRQEVTHLPAPEGFDFESQRDDRLRQRHRALLPPGKRQPHPCGIRGSALRSAYIGPTATPTMTATLPNNGASRRSATRSACHPWAFRRG